MLWLSAVFFNPQSLFWEKWFCTYRRAFICFNKLDVYPVFSLKVMHFPHYSHPSLYYTSSVKKSQQAKWLIKPGSLWFHSTRVPRFCHTEWKKIRQYLFPFSICAYVSYSIWSTVESHHETGNRKVFFATPRQLSAQIIWSMNVVHPASE